MTPRRTHRGSSGPPGAGRRRGPRKIRSGAGGGKKGMCEFALPVAALRTVVALGQLFAVNWRIRGVK